MKHIILPIILIFFLASASAETLILQDGLNGYAGTKDNGMDKSAPLCNKGNYIGFGIGGTDQSSMLLSFDLSQIPAGSTITSATLFIYSLEDNRPQGALSYAYELKKDWEEGTNAAGCGNPLSQMPSNWTQASSSVNWQQGGATGTEDIYPTGIPSSEEGIGWIEWDFTSLVDSWVNDSASHPNYGAVLHGTSLDTWNGVKVYSRNYAIDTSLRPKITIIYDSGAEPTCSDGTLYDQCSLTKPLYCSGGTLVNSCSQCGCPPGETCEGDGSCSSGCIPETEICGNGIDEDCDGEDLPCAGGEICGNHIDDNDDGWYNEDCGDGYYKVRSTHPRIYLTEDNLDMYRCRVGSSLVAESFCNSNYPGQWRSHIDEWNVLKSTVDGDYPTKDNAYIWAFFYLMTGDTSYAEEARAVMVNFYNSVSGNWGKDSEEEFLATDWLFNYFSESEKELAVTRLLDTADSEHNSSVEYGGGGVCAREVIPPLISFNHSTGPGEVNQSNSVALEHLEWAFNRIDNQWLPTFNLAYGDGSGFAKEYEAARQFNTAIELTYSLYTAMGDASYLENTGFIQNGLYFYYYQSRPAWAYSSYGAGSTLHGDGKFLGYTSGLYGPTELGQMLRLSHIRNLFDPDDELARVGRWLADYGYIYQGLEYIILILWDDRHLGKQDPSFLPDSRFFDVYGTVYFKSGYDYSKDSTDISSAFRAELITWAHNHWHQGTFTIARGQNRLALDSGIYQGAMKTHHWDYHKQTISHNTMLIYNPDETEAFMYGRPVQQYSNSGGQRLVPYPENYPSQLPTESPYERGSIISYDATNDYIYSLADIATAYPASTVDYFQRSFTIIDKQNDPIFIVHDRINSPSPDFKKSWLLHSVNVPTIEDSGRWTEGSGNSYGGTKDRASTDAKLLSVSEGNSKLYVNTLLPAESKITKIGGQDSSGHYNTAGSYEFYAAGENCVIDYHRYAEEDADVYGKWRIEVSPQNPSNFDNFLHVLYPTSSSGTMFPTAAIDGGNLVGALIEKTGGPWVTMFGKTGDTINSVNYEFTTNLSGIKNLVSDLEPNAAYDIIIERNGTPTTQTVTSSSEGTLYFTT